MNRFFAKVQSGKCLLVLTIIFTAAISKLKAQNNPYNMQTQFSAYMHYQNYQDMVNRKMREMQQSMMFNRAKDAGEGKNGYYRNEIGVGMVYARADYNLKYHAFEFGLDSNYTADTAFSMTVSPKYAINISVGSGYPLATLSENSALVIGYSINYTYFKWEQPELNLLGKERKLNIKSYQLSVPITLDYKSGADAMLDVGKRNCFTIGLGVQPTYISATAESENPDSHFAILPTAKVEFGFASRFCAFKLRATGNMGKFNYMSFANIHDQPRQSYDLSISGTNQILLSLIIMPFASQWENDAWYRQ